METPADALQKAQWYIRFYGYIVICAAIYGITVAHLPVILGHTWSVCFLDGRTSLPCVLTIHLYDGTLTSALLLFGIYCVKKSNSDTLDGVLGLLTFALAIEIAFFTFEAVELLWNFHNHAATWENYIIASIALILLSGFMLGAYVYHKVSSLLR